MTMYEVAVKETKLVVYRVEANDEYEARQNAALGDKTFEAQRTTQFWYAEEVP